MSQGSPEPKEVSNPGFAKRRTPPQAIVRISLKEGARRGCYVLVRLKHRGDGIRQVVLLTAPAIQQAFERSRQQHGLNVFRELYVVSISKVEVKDCLVNAIPFLRLLQF